jgi:hypothetical protein
MSWEEEDARKKEAGIQIGKLPSEERKIAQMLEDTRKSKFEDERKVFRKIFNELEEELQKVQKEFRERMESEIAKPVPPPAASDPENSVSGKV